MCPELPADFSASTSDTLCFSLRYFSLFPFVCAIYLLLGTHFQPDTINNRWLTLDFSWNQLKTVERSHWDLPLMSASCGKGYAHNQVEQCQNLISAVWLLGSHHTPPCTLDYVDNTAAASEASSEVKSHGSVQKA